MVLSLSNHFLACLSSRDRSLLDPYLTPVQLTARQVLQPANEKVSQIYFPRTGIMSLLVTFSDGRMAEAGLVGSNTAVGLSAAFGDDIAFNLVTVQIAGAADKIERGYLQQCTRQSEALAAAIRRHEQALLAQSFQIAGCNAVHSAQERLCRWLLQCRDMLDSDDLPLTQEFLAALLGVRRSSVTLIAGELEKAGLIGLRRGQIHLLRIDGLEDAACECYGTIRDQLSRLIGWTPARDARHCL